MNVSIVTVVRNAHETVADAVESVLGQTYPEIEYVVVDGASDDGTLEVLQGYRDRIDVLVSEPDDGLYSALNKAIGFTTGDIVGLVHADDRFASDLVVDAVVTHFVDTGSDAVYGDLDYVHPTKPDRVLRRWRAGPVRPNAFRWGWMPPHPTLFLRRDLFDRYGMYDPAFGTAADYELVIRYMVKHGVAAAYLPLTVTRMRAGGRSGADITARLRANRADYLACRANGLGPSWLVRWAKPVRKVGQYLVPLSAPRSR